MKSKKVFQPSEWLKTSTQKTVDSKNYNSQLDDAEKVVRLIETKRIDLTSSYSDWLNIGFAFADEFGETGRGLFHRVSQFYPDYSVQNCDKQFDHCLKANGQGITLKTFFYHAKKARILVQPFINEQLSSTKSKELNTVKEFSKEPKLMPTFPDSLFSKLPDFLQRATQMSTSNEERDIILLGSLGAISACLPKVSGFYDGKRVYSNLFIFITAPASAGKGRLVHCRRLVNPIHKELREQTKIKKQHYEAELAEYNGKKAKSKEMEKPEKPAEKMLFIPANNSSTGAYQLLGDCDGKGLIFETEGDTLANAFKSDYGNYSDGFRKAYEHEAISFYRRTDREYVEIPTPRLSTVLSGTPKQVELLIPSAENGLLSRFMFYYMNVRPVWKNVFANKSKNGLEQHFDGLGEEFFNLYNSLKITQNIDFSLTSSQKQQFHEFFSQFQEKHLNLQGMPYLATIRRFGSIVFRLSMIFSALRIMETGETSAKIVCDDQDFQASLTMIKVLVKHSSKVFTELPLDIQKPARLNRKEKFLDQLPKHFNRQKYLEVAMALNIPKKTAEGYITGFIKVQLIHRESQDNYINTSIEDK